MKRDTDTGLTVTGLTIDHKLSDVAWAGRLPSMRFKFLHIPEPAVSRLAVLLMLARHGLRRTVVRSLDGS